MTAIEGTELGQPATTGPPAEPAAPSRPTGGGGPAPAPAPPPETDSRPAARPMTPAKAVSLAICLLGVFLLGFAFYLYGLSSVQESRSQRNLYEQLSGQLAQAEAPTGPTAAGNPVAILDIPAIGVKDMVVVEGTTPENLTLGPGHLRNTPLPGQYGVTVLYGRRATFGGPFSGIGQLKPGDTVTAITSQGRSTYTVRALGGSTREVEDPATNRMILLTAGSSTVPTYYEYIDADLTSKVQPTPGDLPDITTQETALSGDSDALALTALWGIALAVVSSLGAVAALRWSPWLAYLCMVPVALAVLWNLYENLAALLPNVY
jgi:sortase A